MSLFQSSSGLDGPQTKTNVPVRKVLGFWGDDKQFLEAQWLRFLILIKKESIIRGQMLTVILEKPTRPSLSQLMLWWCPLKTSRSHTAFGISSRFRMMVVHILEKLKGRWCCLQNQFAPIYSKPIYLLSPAQYLGKDSQLGFFCEARGTEECNALFQCWQVTRLV